MGKLSSRKVKNFQLIDFLVLVFFDFWNARIEVILSAKVFCLKSNPTPTKQHFPFLVCLSWNIIKWNAACLIEMSCFIGWPEQPLCFMCY